MLNRTIEMKLVKKNKNETTTVSQEDNRFKLITLVGHQLERVVHKAGMAALAYVVLDTLRQVAVAQATQK